MSDSLCMFEQDVQGLLSLVKTHNSSKMNPLTVEVQDPRVKEGTSQGQGQGQIRDKPGTGTN